MTSVNSCRSTPGDRRRAMVVAGSTRRRAWGEAPSPTVLRVPGANPRSAPGTREECCGGRVHGVETGAFGVPVVDFQHHHPMGERPQRPRPIGVAGGHLEGLAGPLLEPARKGGASE